MSHPSVSRFAQSEYRVAKIYDAMARLEDKTKERKVLQKLAAAEWTHYQFWRVLAPEQSYRVSSSTVWFYWLIRRIFGFTFTVKLLEHHEQTIIQAYREFRAEVRDPQLIQSIDQIIESELKDEMILKNAIEEHRIKFMSSIVLGLNDGLIELTGALTGFTFALRDVHLVALAGAITGVSASLSMAASSYAQARYEDGKDPVRAAFYTGSAYLIVVVLLVLPFLILNDQRLAAAVMFVITLLIIAGVSGYSTVLYNRRFSAQFLEMSVVSLGVAGLSFLIGSLFRILFGISL